MHNFRIARKAGAAYLNSKFGQGKVSRLLNIFQKWGTGTLVASTAIPLPFPTSMVFAAAGASDYRMGKYLPIVTVCRAARYSAIAVVADLYGRHFIRVLRHPVQYWPWLLLFVVATIALIAAGIMINKQLAEIHRLIGDPHFDLEFRSRDSISLKVNLSAPPVTPTPTPVSILINLPG